MHGKKRKIIHIITSLHMGGTEKFLLALARHQKKTHDVNVVFLKDEGIIALRLRESGIPVRRMKGMLHLFFFLLRQKPDIVHTHLFRANIMGRVIARMAGIPVIISSQQSVDSWKKSFHWFVEKFSAFCADIIIANSKAAAQVLHKNIRMGPGKIKIVYIGIHAGRFCAEGREAFRSSLNIPQEMTVVTYIGRLHKEKGSYFLPRIIAETIRLCSHVVFLIVGYGPAKKDIEKEISDKDLSKYVIMHHLIEDPAPVIAASDIFFLPSLEESFSNAALEAMAGSKPVIITRVGGNDELVDDAVNGYLVPSGNAGSMAEKIAFLCNNSEEAFRMGRNAHAKAGQFSLQSTLEQIDGIYAELLKKV